MKCLLISRSHPLIVEDRPERYGIPQGCVIPYTDNGSYFWTTTYKYAGLVRWPDGEEWHLFEDEDDTKMRRWMRKHEESKRKREWLATRTR